MEVESTIATIKRLQGFFGKKLTPEAFEFYLQEFRLLPETLFRAAVTECQRTEKVFPTVHVLKNYVVEVRRAMEQRDQARGRIKSFADLARENPMDPAYVKECRRIFSLIELPCGSPDHLCGMKLVAAMATMEQAFPGNGWGENGRALQADLEKDAQARVKFEPPPIPAETVLPKPPIIQREFASGAEKAKFYADLFSRKNQP